jgi:hypothetical protein
MEPPRDTARGHRPSSRPPVARRSEQPADRSYARPLDTAHSSPAAARPADATGHPRAAILELVEALAGLAADLWHAGKLDPFPLADEEPADEDPL